MSREKRDVFLCHSSSDKRTLVKPLYEALRRANLSVWYDDAEIEWGDPILGKINEGLVISSFCVICLTPDFIAPGGKWRDAELQAALSIQIEKGIVRVLPLACGVSHSIIADKLPVIASGKYESIPQYNPGEIVSAEEIQRIVDLLVARVKNASMPILVGRDEIRKYVGSVEERLLGALDEVLISGNDCKRVAESASPYIEYALKKGVKIKIITVDPLSDAPKMLEKIDPRFTYSEDFNKSMISVEEKLRLMRERYTNFEFRYLPVLPSMGFFITDPKSPRSIIKIEIYVAKPFDPVKHRPHLIIPSEMIEWRDYFLIQWDNYWNLSREP